MQLPSAGNAQKVDNDVIGDSDGDDVAQEAHTTKPATVAQPNIATEAALKPSVESDRRDNKGAGQQQEEAMQVEAAQQRGAGKQATARRGKAGQKAKGKAAKQAAAEQEDSGHIDQQQNSESERATGNAGEDVQTSNMVDAGPSMRTRTVRKPNARQLASSAAEEAVQDAVEPAASKAKVLHLPGAHSSWPTLRHAIETILIQPTLLKHNSFAILCCQASCTKGGSGVSTPRTHSHRAIKWLERFHIL